MGRLTSVSIRGRRPKSEPERHFVSIKNETFLDDCNVPKHSFSRSGNNAYFLKCGFLRKNDAKLMLDQHCKMLDALFADNVTYNCFLKASGGSFCL